MDHGQSAGLKTGTDDEQERNVEREGERDERGKNGERLSGIMEKQHLSDWIYMWEAESDRFKEGGKEGREGGHPI